MAREDLLAALRRNRQEAQALAARIGRARLEKVMRRAEAELIARMHRAEGLTGPGRDSFTYHQLKVTLGQVRDVTRSTKAAMGKLAQRQAGEAADKASENLVQYLAKAERQFRGLATQPLALREAAVLDAARSGAQASALRRLSTPRREGGEPTRARPGILDRYGAAVIGNFEEELQQGLVQRKPWGEVRAALIERSPFLQGAPMHWAERIVRTETAHAYNRAGWEGIREADQQLGGVCKIVSATIDERTGGDSLNVHGEVRRPDEPFEYIAYDGSVELFMHPPNRPNDREVVVPHRLAWPIPPYLLPLETEKVAARYQKDKQKFHGRPSVMSTLPASAFGAG